MSLTLQVLDAHVGKSRETDTLSGGASFISALAPLLSFTDVVESESGKVHLHSIFIDEGFGGLDRCAIGELGLL